MAKKTDKKSDIVPRLIDGGDEAVKLIAEKLALTQKALTEMQNQFNDELAPVIEANKEAEEAIRAHVMAGGDLPPGTPFKVGLIEEKEEIGYDQEALAWFEADMMSSNPGLASLIQERAKRVVVVYDGEQIEKLVEAFGEIEGIATKLDRCKTRKIKPQTTRITWEK